MSQMHRLRRSLFLLVICTALPGLALPKYERTTLPFPERMADDEKYMAAEVIKLSVYQDSKDPNQYYFVPPMHIRQYRQGAAGMLLNTVAVKQYDAANKEMEARSKYAEEYTNNRLQELHADIDANRNSVREAEAKLEEALETENPRIIAIYEKRLERENEFLKNSLQALFDANEILKNKKSLLPAGLTRPYNERIVMMLAAAGFDAPYDSHEDPDVVFEKLRSSIKSFAASYGGYLSLNAYGGFTREQLDALIAYKTKYMPHIKVSLLPVDNLSFLPSTELQQNAASASATNFFRNINGSGEYTGAAIIMDTTVIGALALSQHMAPFVPPVAIKATFKQQMEPTEAELICDFKDGFSVNGRSDVRDGLVIFDNDVTTDLHSKDVSNGGCHVKHISGDRASAEYKALFALEQKLEDMHLHRTTLANQEKKAYVQGVLDDIHSNRRKGGGIIETATGVFGANGWQGAVVQVLSNAADFHWHTNIQNVSNLSEFKFEKKLLINGYETIERALPLNLCLVYNPEVNAYDRCTELDESDADGIQKAMATAAGSAACQSATDPIDCGRRRDATFAPREGRASSLHDRNLLEEI